MPYVYQLENKINEYYWFCNMIITQLTNINNTYFVILKIHRISPYRSSALTLFYFTEEQNLLTVYFYK